MLAAQFLNVVLEEKEANVREAKDFEGEDEEVGEGRGTEKELSEDEVYEIVSRLDIKARLAKILLAECTIEPTHTANKRERPVLSFEANVTPIYNVPTKKPKPPDDVSLLTSVEAVYSDGEDLDSEQMVPCPVCNRSFSRNCSLALHMKAHEMEEMSSVRFRCHSCPKTFPDKSFLRKHLTECGSGMVGGGAFAPLVFPPRRYQCQFCQRTYTQKSVLKKHLVVHTGERERCNICGAGFSQRSSLVRHAKRIHGGMVSDAVNANPNRNPIQGLERSGILTTALSNVSHPTLGAPLIVGIPLAQLAAGKYAGTRLAGIALPPHAAPPQGPPAAALPLPAEPIN